MTGQKDLMAKTDPKSVRRCMVKWVERDGEVIGLKRIDVFDEYLDQPVTDSEDKDLAVRLRAQLPYVPPRSVPFGEQGQGLSGLFAPLFLGVIAGAMLATAIEVVAYYP